MWFFSLPWFDSDMPFFSWIEILKHLEDKNKGRKTTEPASGNIGWIKSFLSKINNTCNFFPLMLVFVETEEGEERMTKDVNSKLFFFLFSKQNIKLL